MKMPIWLEAMMPKLWIVKPEYSAIWDNFINQGINEREIRRVDSYRAKLGTIYIWIENYPYAFGCRNNGPDNFQMRPSRKTIIRLKRYIDAADDQALRDEINTAVAPE